MKARRIVVVSAATTIIGTWLFSKVKGAPKVPGFSR